MEKFIEEQSITDQEFPSIRNVLSKFEKDFVILEDTISKEKRKEAKEVSIDFDHKIINTKKDPRFIFPEEGKDWYTINHFET